MSITTSTAPETIAQPVSEVLKEAMEEVALMNDNPEAAGLATGLKALDRHTRYAFAPGGLVLCGGESGSGKTALGQQIATSFAVQVPTLVMTFEDEARDTVKRILANATRLNVGAIRAGFPGVSVPIALDKAAADLSKLQLDYIDRVSLNVLDIARELGSWWHSRGRQFGVVIIDQLSLIAPVGNDDATLRWCVEKRLPTPPGPRATESAQLEWTVRILRIVARRLGICIVILCQLNEQHAEGEKPTMRSFRSSRGIVHESTLALVSWVPKRIKVENPGPGEEKTRANLGGEGWLLCLKGRRTQIFEERVTFLGEHQVFVDPGMESGRFALPEARSAKAVEGMARLTALTQRFDAKHAATVAAVHEARLVGEQAAIEGGE